MCDICMGYDRMMTDELKPTPFVMLHVMTTRKPVFFIDDKAEEFQISLYMMYGIYVL